MTEKLSDVLSRKFGNNIREGSMISNECYISELIKIIKPNVILEIGTLYGCSAALFAQYAKKVFTIDIMSAPETNKLIAESVWHFLELGKKVQSFSIVNDSEKGELIASLNFDMAFIDGGHTYEEVKYDFSCVKKCGIVLFHDYKPSGREYSDCNNIRYDDIVKFIDEIYPAPFIWGPHCGKFALWIDAHHPLLRSKYFLQWKKNNAQQEQGS